jgi:hypothetical protein
VHGTAHVHCTGQDRTGQGKTAHLRVHGMQTQHAAQHGASSSSA